TVVAKFTATGALISSLALSPQGGGSLTDLDVSADGSQLAVGTSAGSVGLMTPSFTGLYWFTAGSSGPVFITFGSLAPSPPPISVSIVARAEGTAGTTSFKFTAPLPQPSSKPVQVSFATRPGSATPGLDSSAIGGTLTFAPGQTSQTVTVLVNGDTDIEPAETFFLDLFNPVNGVLGSQSTGTGTIVNDDVASVSINDISVTEGNAGLTPATFTVTLPQPAASTVTVDWYTVSGEASSGSDFNYAYGTLTFAAGQTSQTVTVNVVGDTAAEYDEPFYVYLPSATGASIAD